MKAKTKKPKKHNFFISTNIQFFTLEQFLNLKAFKSGEFDATAWLSYEVSFISENNNIGAFSHLSGILFINTC